MQPRGGVDLAGVSGQVGLLAERTGGFEVAILSGSSRAFRDRDSVTDYTSRRGNNAAH